MKPIRFNQDNPELRGPAWAVEPLAGAIYALFGNNTWVVAREKMPATLGAVEASHSAAHQETLVNGARFAVICGAPSGNLAVITFSSLEKAAAFLQINPLLAQSLLTIHAGQFQIWFRHDNSTILPKQLVNCEVISSGPVDVVNRVSPGQSGYYGIQTPARLNLRIIQWLPEDGEIVETERSHDDFARCLRDRHLDPVRIASHLKTELSLHWDPLRATFWRREGHGTFYYSKNEVATLIVGFFLGLPLSPTSGQRKKLLRKETIKKVVSAMAAQAVRPLESIDEALKTFLQKNCVPHHGGSITCAEITAAFQKQQLHERAHLISKTLIQPAVRSVIYTAFGIRPSKSIMRDGKAQNGFRNLHFTETSQRPTS